MKEAKLESLIDNFCFWKLTLQQIYDSRDEKMRPDS